MQNLPFDHLFCNFIPGEDLSGKLDTLVIEHAELSREVRCLTLWLFSETYLTQKDEQSLQAALTAQYGLRRAELHLHFPEALLPQMDFRDLAQVFIRAYSPAAGSLAGAKYELTGGKLSIHLPANGKAELEPHIPKAQNFLKSRFGVAPEIEITAHSALEGRALFDETARIRREAMPQPGGCPGAGTDPESGQCGALLRNSPEKKRQKKRPRLLPPRRRPRAI